MRLCNNNVTPKKRKNLSACLVSFVLHKTNQNRKRCWGENQWRKRNLKKSLKQLFLTNFKFQTSKYSLRMLSTRRTPFCFQLHKTNFLICYFFNPHYIFKSFKYSEMHFLLYSIRTLPVWSAHHYLKIIFVQMFSTLLTFTCISCQII